MVDFTEPMQVQFVDETFDAVLKILSMPLCWRSSVWKRSASVSTMSASSFRCTEVKAASSKIIQSFLGKDSPRTALSSFSLAAAGVGPCGVGCLGNQDQDSWVGPTTSPKPPLNPHLYLGDIMGVPCWGRSSSGWGNWGCMCLLGTLTIHGASVVQEHF